MTLPELEQGRELLLPLKAFHPGIKLLQHVT